MKEKLQRVIDSFMPGAELLKYEPLMGGVSSEVFLLEIKKDAQLKKIVLREESGPPAKNTSRSEFELLQALQRTNIPCAEPLFLDTTRTILDKPFVLLSFIEGSIDIAKMGNDTFILKMVNQLKAIHEVDIEILPNLSLRLDPLEGLIEYLAGDSQWKELQEYLSSLHDTAYTKKHVFLHGDYWSGNIILENEKIKGVIDWEYAAIGDPLCDVAASCLEVRYEFGKELMTTFKDTYSNFLPIDNFRYSLWLIYIAASTLYHIHQWNISNEREALIKKETVNVINEEFESLLHQSKE